MRHFTLIDKILTQADAALTTVFTATASPRSYPADNIDDTVLITAEKKDSIGYMRVNHTGEVCAQALYRAQLLLSRDQKTQCMLEKSCIEETDHLAWTKKRLTELNGRTSYLNCFWYAHSFLIGAIAGVAGDRWSLGFVDETEIQVTAHLENHLAHLSEKDRRSRAIIKQMRDEEIAHSAAAVAAGAVQLPLVIKKLMQLNAKVMATLTYYI